jgi:hypothetical protein
MRTPLALADLSRRASHMSPRFDRILPGVRSIPTTSSCA